MSHIAPWMEQRISRRLKWRVTLSESILIISQSVLKGWASPAGRASRSRDKASSQR